MVTVTMTVPFLGDIDVDMPDVIWWRGRDLKGPVAWNHARVLRSPAKGLVTLKSEDEMFGPAEVTYGLDDITWRSAYEQS